MKSRHLFWIIAVVFGASLFSAQGWADSQQGENCPSGQVMWKDENGEHCVSVGKLPTPYLVSDDFPSVPVCGEQGPHCISEQRLPVYNRADRNVSHSCQDNGGCENGYVCAPNGQCLAEAGNDEPSTDAGDDTAQGDQPLDDTSNQGFLLVEHIPTPLTRMVARFNLRWLGGPGRLVPFQLPPGTDVAGDETGDDPNSNPNNIPSDDQPVHPIMEEVETIEGGGGCALVAGAGASSNGVALLLGFIAIAATSFRRKFGIKRTSVVTMIGIVLAAAAACSDGDDLGSGPVPPPNPEETAITIDSIVPAEAMPGGLVEIRGSGLEEETDIIVSGSTEVQQEEGASGDGLITIKIPDDAQPGPFPVKVRRGAIESNEVIVTVVTQTVEPPTESKAMLSVSGPDQAVARIEVTQACLSKTKNCGARTVQNHNVNIYTIEWKLPDGIDEAVLYAPVINIAASMSLNVDVTYEPDVFTEQDREALATAVQEGGNDSPSDFITAFEKCTGKSPSNPKHPHEICKQLKLDVNAGSIKTVVSTTKRPFTINFIVLEYQDVDGTTRSETVEGPF